MIEVSVSLRNTAQRSEPRDCIGVAIRINPHLPAIDRIPRSGCVIQVDWEVLGRSEVLRPRQPAAAVLPDRPGILPPTVSRCGAVRFLSITDDWIPAKLSR